MASSVIRSSPVSIASIANALTIVNVKREKAKHKENDGGPSGYVLKYHNLGQALVDVVHRNFKDHNLTHTNAARLLGGKAISIPGFLNYVESVRRKSVQGNGHTS